MIAVLTRIGEITKKTMAQAARVASSGQRLGREQGAGEANTRSCVLAGGQMFQIIALMGAR
jgi:hypothetical protein